MTQVIIRDFPNYTIDIHSNIYSKYSNKFISTSLTKNGYSVVFLYNDGIRYCRKVHRLLCIAFLDNPENYPVVDHKNNIRSDNRIENLRWTNNRGNCHNLIKQSIYGHNITKVNRKRCYFVRILIDGYTHSKTFESHQEAIEHRDSILEKLKTRCSEA